jgi:hypothetical protein
MRHFFNIYQYLALMVIFPLAYYFWLQRYEGDHELVILIMSIPILFSYIVPAVGTNWLKIWDFDTRFKLGRFRFQHGFVFGSATSLITVFVLPLETGREGLLNLLWAAFTLGSVLALWNWLYDLFAIKAHFLLVYNRAWHEGQKPETISLHYAPAFFGMFGLFYGAAVIIIEGAWYQRAGHLDLLLWIMMANLLVLALSVGGYGLLSYLTIGETGFKSYEQVPKP